MSSEIDSLDIVIIGGGVAGLTTAALLARAGKAGIALVFILLATRLPKIGNNIKTSRLIAFLFPFQPLEREKIFYPYY